MALHLVSDGMVIELTEEELMVDVGLGRPQIRPTVDPFVAELADFLAAARGGADRIRAPYREALRTQRLTTGASESARSGRPIDLRVEANEEAAGAAVLSLGS
jgi:predicted dehydrogenase